MEKFGGIGVIDKGYRNEPELTRLQNPLSNQIKYWSDRDVRNGKTIKSDQGSGYKTHEKVTVVVDFNAGSVEWRVNQNLRHKVQNNQLKNKSIKWVPCIYLNNEGDIASLETDLWLKIKLIKKHKFAPKLVNLAYNKNIIDITL